MDETTKSFIRGTPSLFTDAKASLTNCIVVCLFNTVYTPFEIHPKEQTSTMSSP